MKSNGHGGRREGSGRKANSPQEKKHSLQVYLTKEELDIIDKLAEEKQIRRSALAREILINALRFVKLQLKTKIIERF